MKHTVELKIKIKSLAAEAAIIRHEERKNFGMSKWNLQNHRKTVVRDAARRALIAYTHIWGHDISVHMHSDTYQRLTDLEHVVKMVQKYGDAESVERIPQLKTAFVLYDWVAPVKS